MIKVNEYIPQATGFVIGANGPESLNADRLFKGKVVAVIGVPAAFSGTCSRSHIPNYLKHEGSLREHGVESLICVSVNDAFVMHAWGKQMDVAGRMIMFGDSNAELTKGLGLTIDLSEAGLGIRSKRYAMLVRNCRVDYLAVEENSLKLQAAKAEDLLDHLAVGAKV